MPVEARTTIIDQLNPTYPNPNFIDQVTTVLQNDGFKVDYYKDAQVTVDLYRQLPTLGYNIIIFRAHAGLLGNGSKIDQKTCLFTNQPYDKNTEIGDQLSNRLVKAAVDNKPPLFGIGADFVKKSMRGKFKGTAVIMMGCSSIDIDDLARAFLDKGASIYTGWNTEVGLQYVEDATLTLLVNLYSNNLSIKDAVSATMQEKGPDPGSGAILRYYPDNSGTMTFSELLK